MRLASPLSDQDYKLPHEVSQFFEACADIFLACEAGKMVAGLTRLQNDWTAETWISGLEEEVE